MITSLAASSSDSCDRADKMRFGTLARAYALAIPRPIPREAPAMSTVKFSGNVTSDAFVGPSGLQCRGSAKFKPAALELFSCCAHDVDFVDP